MSRKGKTQKPSYTIGSRIALGLLGSLVGEPPKRTKKSSDDTQSLIVVGVVLGVIFLIIQTINFLEETYNKNPVVIIIACGFIGILLTWWLNQRNKQKELDKINHENYLKKLNQVAISDERADYIIKKEDYKRGNKIENEYRKKYSLQLLNLFNNKCAKCGSIDNGFDLDHFILSKNEGGNFILINKDGYRVNNAIPLCQTCNRSKGDRSYKDFFSEEEILSIFEKNKEMTLVLNDQQNLINS
ncbi:HNH endonuclease [Thiothrix subterranea]|uniref:HNH endonuclease n=1 Tax=Thiothrix subterranea TaxID=2735563 RepID=UPI00192B862C|nr:HNH endonuclease [Thiothrix subterranea]QQZ29748.1 HNH endonuclease [Thiothrix subterranea]